jgi:hypothetical protein
MPTDTGSFPSRNAEPAKPAAACAAAGRVLYVSTSSTTWPLNFTLTVKTLIRLPALSAPEPDAVVLTLPTRRAEEWDSSLRSESRRGPAAVRLACVDTGRPPSPSRERVSSPRKCLRSPVPIVPFQHRHDRARTHHPFAVPALLSTWAIPQPQAYDLITTGVPRRMYCRRIASARADTRRQPAEAAVPIDAGSFVPWIASWSPPVQPWGRFGW